MFTSLTLTRKIILKLSNKQINWWTEKKECVIIHFSIVNPTLKENEMKKLYRVKGRIRKSYYMVDRPEYEDFDLLVEAESLVLAKILVYQTYEKKTSDYDVYYSVDIDDAQEAFLSGEIEPEYLEKYAYLLKYC